MKDASGWSTDVLRIKHRRISGRDGSQSKHVDRYGGRVGSCTKYGTLVPPRKASTENTGLLPSSAEPAPTRFGSHGLSVCQEGLHFKNTYLGICKHWTKGHKDVFQGLGQVNNGAEEQSAHAH